MAFDRNQFFTSLEESALWGVPVAIQRTNALPLDNTEVFKTLADAEAYAQDTTRKAYPGQIIAVIAEDGSNSYFGISQDRTLESIGGSTEGDNKTIVLKDGILSLKNFGETYFRYDAEDAVEHYKATAWNDATYPAPDTLDVKVVKIAEGSYELAYYQPNPTTVEGLQSAISGLQTTVANMYTKNDVYNRTEIDNKFKDFPAWEDIEQA